MAPLSDDEYEYEDISSAAVARLTIVVAGHVDAVRTSFHVMYVLCCGRVGLDRGYIFATCYIHIALL